MAKEVHTSLAQEDATEDEIKKAYRTLAMLHHPDKNPGSEEAAKVLFQQVSAAFQRLKVAEGESSGSGEEDDSFDAAYEMFQRMCAPAAPSAISVLLGGVSGKSLCLSAFVWLFVLSLPEVSVSTTDRFGVPGAPCLRLQADSIRTSVIHTGCAGECRCRSFFFVSACSLCSCVGSCSADWSR